MTNFIGRQRVVGLAKETVRGTAVVPQYWFPAIEFSNDDKIVQAVNESSYGVISDADDTKIVKKYSEAELTAKMDNETFPLVLLATLGGDAGVDLVGGETEVYQHNFNVGNNAQHPTLTLTTRDPINNQANSLAYPLSSISSLEVVAELEQFVQYTISLMGNRSELISTGSPSYVNENVFLPQHCTVSFYDTYNDAYDDIDPTTYPFRRVAFTISKNVEDDQVLGNVNVADRFNKQFAIEGTLEILYSDRTLIDDILMADVAKAMKIKMVDTSVTLGVASNPEVVFNFAKVKLSEIAREQGNNDIVKQTLSFKAFYSVSDQSIIEAWVKNLNANPD